MVQRRGQPKGSYFNESPRVGDPEWTPTVVAQERRNTYVAQPERMNNAQRYIVNYPKAV